MVGSRVALVDRELVGVAMMVGHGHTSVAVDPTIADAAAVRLTLFEWVASFGDVSGLPTPAWPSGVAAVPFRPGADDEELHEMISSFWTDVPGHTSRPIDEWRALLVTGP